MWKRRVYKVGGKYYAQHNVLNRGTTGMTHTNPFARSDRGTKRRKSSKEVESSRDPRLKEKEPSHTVDDSGVQQNQEFDMDRHNPEGKSYPFDLRKLLPLIPGHRGRQVIPQDYFINNDLEYLKGGSLSRHYSISVTKTKAATYEIKWIKDMVPNLWSLVKVVEDLQLGVKSYQKKLNLTKPDTFRSDLRKRTAYTAYSNPPGVIYEDQNNQNRLIRTDEFHKFSDGTLDFVHTALHDIASRIRMEYMPTKN
uniref:Uncharacterized protein n=1 Tax=Tanacetum cinerariifolium TaxID=118510 RepID=A0A6L2LJI8_TANCI|nr:hypothetical protein [Tanacetum cinerariifolium]